jgi:phosphoribosyl 1,2-cyclic phosphodiesterase
MAAEAEFWIRFWGVRGTVPCPGPETLRFGGNTACVEVRCGNERLIFDAGTGIRPLGREWERNGRALRAHIFLTHTHLDHVAGLPFFRPAYVAENCFQLWAGHLARSGHRLQNVLGMLMQPPLFPVPLDILHACIGFHDFEAGDTLRPCEGVVIRTARLSHPGGATGYRVEYGGRAFCYITDTEHEEGELDRRVLGLIEGADLVVYDSTYTDEEYPDYRGWGHSTWQQGVRLCEAANAGRLVAFHHDPDHDDEALDRIAAELDRVRPGSVVAREGLVLAL